MPKLVVDGRVTRITSPISTGVARRGVRCEHVSSIVLAAPELHYVDGVGLWSYRSTACDLHVDEELNFSSAVSETPVPALVDGLAPAFDQAVSSANEVDVDSNQD